MSSTITARKFDFAGLFMISLSILMFEIILTRIFSVSMWYHFAFMAISIAMFGMTFGAILVFVFDNYFAHYRTNYQLAQSALLFSISIVLSFIIYIFIPFSSDGSIGGVFAIIFIYGVTSVPFVFGGICVCLALTRFSSQISKLYASDLIGAGFGCILSICILKITDGPTAIIFVAFLASIGACLFAYDIGNERLRQVVMLSSFLLISIAVTHTILVKYNHPILKMKWVKGKSESRTLYEKWNSFSRISVLDKIYTKPFGWGISPIYRFKNKVPQHWLKIDAGAATVITHFDGDLNKLDYLKYDVTNLAHYLRNDSNVLVIGSGGGRDILTALVFEQKSVLGIEINEEINKAVNGRFGPFTGHLDKHPKVSFVSDEARSYITRLKDKFDIIQLSLIDTWAATAAGAFVLSENSLYTVEAWEIFLNHLTPNGVFTATRWYNIDNPGEVYRITSLAVSALNRIGIQNPRDHILILRRLKGKIYGMGTLLVSNNPFSKKDLAAIKDLTEQMNFELVLSPGSSIDDTFSSIASGRDLDRFTAKYPINIAAPTDDSPFFFHMLRFKDIFDSKVRALGMNTTNMKAVFILSILLITVFGLTFFCIIVPLILNSRRAKLKGGLLYFIFFSCIGFGFMFIEISQLQRLIVFLGHPTYSLSVVLFSLLLSSGVGSYLTQKINKHKFKNSAILRLFFLIIVLLFFGLFTPSILTIFSDSTTMLRILLSVGILVPLGLFLGMAFPIGMRIASSKSAFLTPWLWGINGATSVCASVLAVAIALFSGISASFWTGFWFYVVAFLAFALSAPERV